MRLGFGLCTVTELHHRLELPMETLRRKVCSLNGLSLQVTSADARKLFRLNQREDDERVESVLCSLSATGLGFTSATSKADMAGVNV